MEADTSECLLKTLSSFCQLRLQNREVFFLPQSSLICDLSAFCKLLRDITKQHRDRCFLSVLFFVVERIIAETSSTDEQLLVCWMVCDIFATRKDELSNLFRESRVLKGAIQPVLLSSWLGEAVLGPIVPDAPETIDTSSAKIGASASCTPTVKATRDEPHLRCSFGDDGEVARHPRMRFPKRQAVSKSVSLLLEESREAAKLLLLSARMAESRKYIRVFCLRQLDDYRDYGQLQAAVKQSSAEVLFVQRRVDKKLRELLYRQNVLCVDRLGQEKIDQFCWKLGWVVYESCNEWLFSLQALDGRCEWKCWVDTRPSRAGTLLLLHAKGSPKSQSKAKRASAAGHSVVHGSKFAASTNCGCTSALVGAELLDLWQKSFLWRLHIGAVLIFSKKRRTTDLRTFVAQIAKHSTLEMVFDALCLLCRCQL